MDGDLSIRSMQERDTDGILALLRLSLGDGSIPRTVEYWSWKHRKNPFGPSATIVAESAGEVVGLRAFMRWTWQSCGKRIRAVRAVDTATHPSWRGRGIFTRLTLDLVEQMKDERVGFVFNTPNQFSRPGYLKMGWTDLGRVSLWIRPRASIRLGRGVLQRIRRKPATEQTPPSGARYQSVRDLLSLPEMGRLEDFQTPNDQGFRTVVDRQYLKWRYADIPGFAYSAAWKHESDGSVAVIFRQRQRGDLKELRFCQILLSGPRSPRLAKEVMREVIKQTRPDYAVAMSSTEHEAKAFAFAGFFPVPRAGPILTVRELNEGPGIVDPLERSTWKLCIGDLELF